MAISSLFSLSIPIVSLQSISSAMLAALPLTPLDPFLDDMVPLSSTHYSPLHSPGIIGHPPLPPSSPHPASSSNLSHSSQPKTPGLTGEFDVAALIAHAARQHEEKKSFNTAVTQSTSGVGVIGDGMTPKRPAMGNGVVGDDIWGTDTVLKRTFSGQAVVPPSPAPIGTRGTQTFQPFSGSPIVPFARLGTPSSAGSRDVVAEVQSHLQALSGLMAPLAGATEEVERLRKEVELWKAEWGKGEKERRRLETIIEEQASSSSGKSGKFSAVLIDGDGLIFQDALLQAGFQGGQLAAKTLLSAIPNLTAQAQMSPVAAHAEVKLNADGTVPGGTKLEGEVKEIGDVIVQVFINKSGLGTAMVKAGVVPSWGVYDSFWQGFSSAHELFTVIDVGSGKEASDAKIREYLRLYAKNVQCDMIVLGASHDNGYANVLSSLQTESRISKLLLLKGYSDLAYQLRQYSSRVVSIPDLFRTSKLPNAPQSFSAIVQATSPPTARPTPKESAAKHAKSASIAETIDTLEGLDLADTDDSVEVIEWEAVKPKKAPSSKDKLTSSKKGKKAIAVLPEISKKLAGDEDWHEATGRKIGKKYKGKGAIAVASVRKLNPRPCHTFYLSPWGCKAGDDCDYSHEYRLTSSQEEELSRLAKEIICPHVRNSRCHYTEEECVYGHRCPRGNKCNFGETCRFNVIDNAHGEDD